MKRPAAILLIFLSLLFSGQRAAAQYYSWGDSPASTRWRQIKTPQVRMIYPQGAERLAERMLFYMDTIRSSIGYGFSHGAMHTPVIMHTGNMVSNGLVMWAPKRMDIISTPSIDTYSEPWLKQLAAHEYRHNVQYNNINRGVIRVFSYIIGQQAPLIGLAQIPIWFIEGDAVMAETSASEFGRALQPSFTIRYRAMEGIPQRKWQQDRWFCGSYKHDIPDHYQLGYQIVRYTQTRYGTGMWNDIVRYSARNPYMINPKAVRLRRRYDTSISKMMRQTFDTLYSFWASLPERENSSQIISRLPSSHTEYSHPLPTDGNCIVAMRSDMDRPNRIIALSISNGEEKDIAYTGSVSTRPCLSLDGKTMYWTEYRQSLLWSQKVSSQICSISLDSGRKRTLRSKTSRLYPTPTRDGIFCIEYDPAGIYSIVSLAGDKKIALPDSVSVHGLAWDNQTDRLYFIGLSDGGMWFGEADSGAGTWNRISEPKHITLSSLRAADGKLYFGSIISGFDEAHMFEIASGRSYRITTSRYGSFSPAPENGANRIALVTYTRQGYMLAIQSTDSLSADPDADLPLDIVNLPLPEKKILDMDSVATPLSAPSCYGRGRVSKRMPKFPNLLHIHSWMPFEFNPYTILPETDDMYQLGATVMSQDLLSSCTGFVSYGYSSRSGSRLRFQGEYSGLGPVIGLSGQWGGGGSVMYDQDITLEQPAAGLYLDLSAYVSVPMLLGSGYHIRRLTPSVEYTFNNGYTIHKDKYVRGVHRITASLQFSDYVRQATRNILPRWGYLLRGALCTEPSNSDFKTLLSIYAAGYLPAIAANHSIMLRANYQTAVGEGKYTFRRKELFPRGALYDFSPEEYAAASLDYQLPLCYPDWGIPSVIFLKRIRLNLWADYAYCKLRYPNGLNRYDLYSYGADVILDICPFRLPSQATTSLKITLAAPSDRGGVRVLMGVELPL